MTVVNFPATNEVGQVKALAALFVTRTDKTHDLLGTAENRAGMRLKRLGKVGVALIDGDLFMPALFERPPGGQHGKCQQQRNSEQPDSEYLVPRGEPLCPL